MQELREEIAALKAENSRLSQRLDEAIKLLNNQHPQRERSQQRQAPATSQWEQGRVPLPPSLTPRHHQPQPAAASKPAARTTKPTQAAPRPTPHPPTPKASPASLTPSEETMEDQDDETTQANNNEEHEQEPRTKSGVSVAVRLRRCTERIDRLERRMDAFEHRVNARFAAVERRLDALQEFLYKKLGRDDDAPDTRNPAAQSRTPSWPANQPAQA